MGRICCGLLVVAMGASYTRALIAQEGAPAPSSHAAQMSSSAPVHGVGPVEILSDTQGVDFGPYLKGILRSIYDGWVKGMPDEAKPPTLARGQTDIRVTLNPDGMVAAMHLDANTHDDALNRAAWGAITGVGQYPPLPAAFKGPNLVLRIHFLVNQRDVAAANQGAGLSQ